MTGNWSSDNMIEISYFVFGCLVFSLIGELEN